MKKRMLTLSSTLLAMLLVAGMFVGVPAYADETTATVTLEAGQLKLISAPSMDFGSHALTGATLNLAPSDTLDYSIVVQDLRGNGNGWNLTVALNTFSCSSIASDSLPGANITVASASVVSDDVANPALVPGGALTLTAGSSAQKVFYAEADKGMMNNTCTWALVNVALNIPADPILAAEAHTSQLVWTLTDGPGA